MTDILTLIKDSQDRKFTDIQSIKDSKIPVLMYGAGSYAKDVEIFLEKNGVAIDAYCVDAAYLKQSIALAKDGQDIFAIEQIPEHYSEFNIIIGFSDYKSARRKLEEIGIETRVYFIDAPNQLGFFNRDYIVDHKDEFQEIYNQLADEKSKDIFIDFINAKISGDPSPLYPHAEFNQYFGDPVTLSADEVFVDCGAFDGDTIRSFLKNTHNSYQKIFAIEPDKANYQKLKEFVDEQKLHDAVLVNAAAWSEQTRLNFSPEANMATIMTNETETTTVAERVDDIVGESRVTFIKMDIEGAELNALKGAENTIKKNLPLLAICIYHKPDDLITIPQYIQRLDSNYRLYLRHHQHMSWETVLYAIQK